MDWCVGDGPAPLLALDEQIAPTVRKFEGTLPNGSPRRIYINCSTVADAECHWLRVLKIEADFEEAEMDVEYMESGHVKVHLVSNVRLFEIVPQVPAHRGASLTVGGQLVSVPPTVVAGERLVVFNKAYPGPGDWMALDTGILVLHGKSPGVQGPIEDAFQRDSFVVVRGTGTPWHPAAESWAQNTLNNFQASWAAQRNTELPVVADTDLHGDAILHNNLVGRDHHLFPQEPHSVVECLPQVLFGDPGSNLWITRALPWLPLLGWSKDAGFNIGQADAWQWSFSEYGLSMVCLGLVLQPWRWLSDQPLNLRELLILAAQETRGVPL